MIITKNKSAAIWALSLFIINSFTSCGEEKKEETPTKTVATVIIENAPKTAENQTYELKTTSACTLNADSGLFSATFSQGSDTLLTVSIKGFATIAKKYTCTQATDNTTGDVGGKFDSCSVLTSIPAPDTDGKFNTYAMYRNSGELDDLTYTGNCSIDITYEEKVVTGNIVCADMIQSYYRSIPRNPIDTSTTAEIATGSNFTCTVK